MKISNLFLHYVKFVWGCRHCGYFNVHELDWANEGDPLAELLQQKPQKMTCFRCREVSKGRLYLTRPFGKTSERSRNKREEYWKKFKLIEKKWLAGQRKIAETRNKIRNKKGKRDGTPRDKKKFQNRRRS